MDGGEKDQSKHAMPTHCPVSGEPLEVTRLHCPKSGVTIEGRFQPNEFALLPPENLEFLRLFVKVRGNLKEVERILGLSYPTIRQRFETLVAILGYETLAEHRQGRSERRSEILERLERGELGVDEAARALQELKGS
ncbi:MAG: DUF2089 domain-containing protein [Trueperaceae bacterium]